MARRVCWEGAEGERFLSDYSIHRVTISFLLRVTLVARESLSCDPPANNAARFARQSEIPVNAL